MNCHRVTIEGVGFWAPTMPGWPMAQAVLRGEAGPQDPPTRRPAPQALAPAERRRAPDTVALALEVAGEAVAASGRAAAALPSVFASSHGDLAINDHLCSMLAGTPTLISPTKFHNSVLNAAAGYWTMAAGCHAASTAITAFDASFANALLAGAVQCATDDHPVLVAAYDIEAVGALASVTRSTGLLAVALVLAPGTTRPGAPVLQWQLEPGTTAAPAPRCEPARALATNALADALPFFETLACAETAPITLRLGPALGLRLQLLG